MKAIIVYYSQTGNTEKVAKEIGKILDSEEIDVRTLSIERSRTRTYDQNVEDAKKEEKAKIEEAQTDLSDFDMLFIGTPVWCGKPATPVNAYVNQCERLDGIDIIPFLTHGGGGPSMTFDKIKNELEPKGGNVVEELSLSSKEVDTKAGKEKVEELISRLV
ncbi:MAG: flavodoxin family protein [Candidatus Natronoplasma sp.]